MRHSAYSFLRENFIGGAIAMLAFVIGFGPGTLAAQKSKPLPHALLWEVKGKNLKQPSYVFGTIHMIPEEDFFLPKGFEEVFAKVDKVVFEIDLDNMSDMSSMMGMMSSLMMNDGTTLSKLMSKQDYQEVSDYFGAMGLPMMLLDRVKPMFLSMLAEVNMDPTQLQSEDIVSYEMEIYEKANEVNMDVGGLETMAYQLSIFDKIPYRDQAQMLLEAIRQVEVGGDGFDEIVDLYKKQNIEAMVSMMAEGEDAEFAGYEDVLLNDRNRNWIPLMIKKMEKKPVLFAVGAGHLGGAQGVIRLLQAEGYKVKPVSVQK